MPKMIGYTDAVRLLDGSDSKLLRVLEAASHGLLLGTAVVVSPLAALGLVDARAEIVRLTRGLILRVGHREIADGNPSVRAERVEAAHTLLVVASFFEELDSLPLPMSLADADLTPGDQVRLVAGDDAAERRASSLVDALARASDVPSPLPHESHDSYVARLQQHYAVVASEFLAFLEGLSLRDETDDTEWSALRRQVLAIPVGAAARYSRSMTALAADFPEVAIRLQMREHQASQIALADLSRLVRDSAGDRTPQRRRANLAEIYAAALQRPVLQLSEIPEGVRVPALGAAYVPPAFRIRAADRGMISGEEAWWAKCEVRSDLGPYLFGHLSTIAATRAPLLVLGQPGAGKSVLARVLAASLMQGAFLPVLVPLRDVSAVSDLQGQIEQSVRAAIGDPVNWVELVSAAGGALPVIILDGFDELLQATEIRQSDYLSKVQAFQQREADLGRPVAVVITSRSSVIEQAPAVPGTVAMRLEPFDLRRIKTWLEVWNLTNHDGFEACGITPLDLVTVQQHADLAGQPLLLLMLALYDAEGNALRAIATELDRRRLYEGLLRRFAGREVLKRVAGQTEAEFDRAVESELQLLSLVAFAIFNRASQHVTQEQLDDDLDGLLGRGYARPAHSSFDNHLSRAQLTLGRFFFIHEAQIQAGGRVRHSYEFLHATFAEYLVARLTWQELRNLQPQRSLGHPGAEPEPADDLLQALLSFRSLALSGPTIRFLTAMAEGQPLEVRELCSTNALSALRAADRLRMSYPNYVPRPLGAVPRYAIYSSNLLILGLTCRPVVMASDLFPGQEDIAASWHRQALLWHSQIGEDAWGSLMGRIRLSRRTTDDGRADVELALHTNPASEPSWSSAETNLAWLIASRPGHQPVRTGRDSRFFLRQAHWQAGEHDDLLAYLLEPVLRSPLGDGFAAWPSGHAMVSPMRLLNQVMAVSLVSGTPEERGDEYRACVGTLRELSATEPATNSILPFIQVILKIIRGDQNLREDERDRLLRSLQESLATHPTSGSAEPPSFDSLPGDE